MTGSIATRLIVVLTLCTALILGLGLALDYRLSRQQLMDRLAVEARDTIAAVVIDLENLLDGVEATTGLLGRILQQREYSQAGLSQMLRDVLENNPDVFGGTIALAPDMTAAPQGFSPYFFRRDGGLAFADLASGAGPYWEQPWYADAAARGAPVWSEPYFDRGGGEVWMTTYSVPVFRFDERGDRFLYAVVTADITLHELRDYLQRLRPGGTGFAVLLSRQGKLLSSLQDGDRPAGEIVGREVSAADWAAALDAMDSGQVIARSLPCPHADGQCSLRMRALDTTGWPVGVMFSEDDILAPLQNYQRNTLAIGLATLLGMALAVFLVTRRMTRPLTELAVASGDIARGRLDVPLPRTSGNDEIARLVGSFSAMMRDLQTYIDDLEQVTAGRARLEGELAAAAEIQMAMLPGEGQAYERWPEATLWAALRPARSVGGDLYTYRRRGNTLLLVIGDVSDKGVPAALFMARAIGLVQQFADGNDEPGQVLSRLNDALEQGNQSCMFVTLLLGVLDLDSGLLAFASAGHAAPLLLRDGEIHGVEQDSGPALGLLQAQDFPDNRLQLQAGDRLAFYTDGIDEAFDGNARMFGVEGLAASVARGETLPLSRAGRAIIADVDRHGGEAPQSDDISLLLLQFGSAGQPDGCGEADAQFPAGAGLASAALGWLRDALARAGLPAGIALEIELVAEEILTNIEKYAGLTADGGASVSLAWQPDAVSLTVEDDGEPFDPLTQSQRAARGSDTESAAVGGLGVHLITQLSDRQFYRRDNNRNVLGITRDIRQDLSRGALTDSNDATGEETGPMELTTTVTVDEENSVARVLLDGALNTDTAPAFEQRLQAVVDGGHQLIVLDMKQLEYISSAGLRVIFKAAKQTGSEGRKLAAANRKPHIDKVFEILKALPDMAVFANDAELDDYLTAMQDKTRDS